MSEAQQICEVCHLPLESMHFHNCAFVPDENQTLRDERDRLKEALEEWQQWWLDINPKGPFGSIYKQAQAALTPANGGQDE